MVENVVTCFSLGHSVQWLEIQWGTYSKWHLGYQIVTLLATSRDQKGQGHARYIWMEIS